MRNVFDQYDQPENRLTHALACTLANDRQLIRPFLRWLGVGAVPPLNELKVVEQRVPGQDVGPDDDSGRGLPDMCIYTEDGWVVLFEMKVQAVPTADQLRRHARTIERRGFNSPTIVLVTVEELQRAPRDVLPVLWRKLYAWFGKQSRRSTWARALVEYMQIYESKAIGQDYQVRGTITMFDGLRFDDDNPYTYREGKRLIKLLRDELRARKDLVRLGMDPAGAGRSAITGRAGDYVWDFLPLKVASGSSSFTSHPHLTMSVQRRHATASMTIPNGIKGAFGRKLRAVGYPGFQTVLLDVERNLQPIISRSKRSRPTVYVVQRHYRGQRSDPEIDARLEADLRTMRRSASPVREQPQWTQAIYELLTHKRSNIQFAVEVTFSYDCPVVRSAKAVGLFAESWVAMKPLLDFALKGG